MPGSIELGTCLERIDGRGYKAYRDIEGVWAFSDFDLHIDRVQSDPFASPSKMRVRVPLSVALLPDTACANRVREIASASFLARRIRDAIREVAPRRVGTGKSGLITIDAGGQEVLERTAVVFSGGFVEARVEIGLPAAGRRVLGNAAADILLGALPRIVNRAWLERDAATNAAFVSFVDCVENQEFVRARLAARGLVAFVGNGALLPRESGASEQPMPRSSALPFESPQTFQVEFEVPHPDAGMPGSVWRGMGIPRGVVLLVGGGYHGKSTLLRAIERSIVPHVPGDGRETVVSDPALVKIRAEDGRAVTGVDIHGFIDHLPRVPGHEKQKDTHSFSTTDASGSTSQAANIIEALEIGARGLLLDEDSSATNFMVRDARMQALVNPRDEPITPFLERVRELYDEFDVSTLLVMGASGEYFSVADAIIELKDFQPRDVTERARALVDEGAPAIGTTRPPLVAPSSRVLDPQSFDARRGRREVKLSSRGCEEIVFGTTEINVRGVDQLFDASQTRAIASAIQLAATRLMGSDRTFSQVLDDLEALLDSTGLDVLDPFRLSRQAVSKPEGRDRERFTGHHPGAFARPRRFEIAAAINRMRSLRVTTLERE
jgi:predicted ABC-class ATPase